MEAPVRIELTVEVLQTSGLPLADGAILIIISQLFSICQTQEMWELGEFLLLPFFLAILWEHGFEINNHTFWVRPFC